MIFPRFVDSGAATLRPLDTLQALIRLGEGGSVLPATDAGLAEFLAWLGSTPAYELTYRRLDQGVRMVVDLVKDLRRESGSDGAGFAAGLAAAPPSRVT